MNDLRGEFLLVLLVLLLATCTAQTPTTPSPATTPSTATPTHARPTETAPPPTTTNTVAPTNTPTQQPTATVPPLATPTPAGPCTMTVSGDVTAYTRPSTQATIFGTVPAGSPFTIQARTADGWIGFDPGVAQAANIGVFRLRWVREDDGAVQLTGDCAAVEQVEGPPPGVCFTMPMTDVAVHVKPNADTQVVATMSPGDYAAVEGMAPGDGWAQVDLATGNTGLDVFGWIDAATLNLNGPCDNLITIVP